MHKLVPLSFAQQRLWFIDQLEPGTSTYNVLNHVRLTGRLDQACLSHALREIVARHEVLRTRFIVKDGEPFQEILAGREIPLTFEDLAILDAGERDQRIEAVGQEERTTGFDLARDPLLRCRLVRLSEQDHVLFVTMHHIISDGWSMEVFYQELTALYRAGLNGEPSPLANLPVQYADYTRWQEAYLSGAILERQLGYWKKQLEGVQSLALPTDRPTSQSHRHLNASVPVEIPARLVSGLREVSRRERASLFMVLLAAFKVLLYRYTGQGDIAVGTPMAGRVRPEFENLIGFFVNTLVMRTQVSGSLTFREVLTRVRETVFGAFDNQDMPFDKLVMELHPERDPGRTPFFSVLFNKYNATRHFPITQDLDGERGLDLNEKAKFDLSVIIRGAGSAYSFAIDYDTDLFDRETIERLGRHYRRVLECILVTPDVVIGRLPILEEDERRLLRAWSGRAPAYPRDLCVHELFVRQAAERPDAIAVEHGGERLTYRELEARARDLAGRLISRGVKPGDRVGLLMDRSIPLIVGMLGTLMAGAAYVPLDTSYPAERLRLMAEDAEFVLVLTQGDTRHEGLQGMVPLVEVNGVEASAPVALPDISAEDPAYVIYTSGSTGRPKGVVVPHRAIGRLTHNTYVVRVGLDDVVAYISNPSFDTSTYDVWVTLLNGAHLSIFDRDEVLMPEGLGSLFRQRGVTSAFLPTALFNLVAHTAPDAFASLRCVMIGGEAADPESCRRVLRAGAPGQLVNGYGPTECTAFATYHDIGNVPDDATGVPIGQPLDNTTAYVLDERRQPVPIGVPGELYIGGDALAIGYLNRPELTAERFVPDPFHPRGRLYRTGDRVRWRRDGMLEFLGRFDDQVKIRGYRIEPGEIEAVLGSHPDVKQTVVLALENDRQEKELVAYFVPGPFGAPSIPELQDFLRSKLPDYMVPPTFVMMEAFPLTPNDKIDRRALPRPEFSADHTTYVAPRSPLETDLAAVWAEVLGIERIGIHDNFFDLGAHSLLITVAASRIRDRLRREIPVRVLFDNPTVAELASFLPSQQEVATHEDEDLEALLSDIEQLSDEEAERLLKG